MSRSNNNNWKKNIGSSYGDRVSPGASSWHVCGEVKKNTNDYGNSYKKPKSLFSTEGLCRKAKVDLD